MEISAADPVFIDTNVLIYSSLRQTPLHGTATQAVESLRRAGNELWISRQVLREYLAVLTRPNVTTPPLPVTVVIADIACYENIFRIAEESAFVTSEQKRG